LSPGQAPECARPVRSLERGGRRSPDQILRAPAQPARPSRSATRRTTPKRQGPPP